MATEGPNSPGTIVEDTSVGSASWTNITNVAASDDSRATITLGTFESYYIKCTNFGFSDVSGAESIDGIIVRVEGFRTGDIANYSRVRLVKGGTIGGDNKGGATIPPTTDATRSFGSASDLWGLTLADTDITNSGFGCVVSCDNTGTTSVEIDWIRIEVYYTPAVSLGELAAIETRIIQPQFPLHESVGYP